MSEQRYTQAELNEACQLAVERTIQNMREGRIPDTRLADLEAEMRRFAEAFKQGTDGR